jgi:hypothetical protein
VAALAQEPGRKTYAPEKRTFELGWDFRWPETKANVNRSMATVTLSEVPPVIELGATIRLKAAMRAEWKTSGSHRDASDKKMDQAVLHTDNKTVFKEIIAVDRCDLHAEA